MPEIYIELILMEINELRSELSETQKIPERWGTIMLPLSAGILAVSVNSIETLPIICIGILVFLSIATIVVWRLIGYNSMYRARVIVKRLFFLEKKISAEKLLWKKFYRPGSFLHFMSQRALLDIFALLYIATGIVIIFVKFTSF